MAIGDKCPIGSSVTKEDFENALKTLQCYKNCSPLENELGTGCVPGHFGGSTHEREKVSRQGTKRRKIKKVKGRKQSKGRK